MRPDGSSSGSVNAELQLLPAKLQWGQGECNDNGRVIILFTRDEELADLVGHEVAYRRLRGFWHC